MTRLALGLVLALASSTAHADQAIATKDGTCVVNVPATWKAGAVAGIADSPDKKVSVAVSSPKVDSFAAVKTGAKAAYKDSKVTKDTATELEMSGKSIAGKPDVYRAISVGDKAFCIVEVVFEGSPVDAAWTIARTLKRGK